MAKMQQPRVLYFTKGTAATDDEIKEASQFPGALISFRNSAMISDDGALEDAEFVAGSVPQRYLNARNLDGGDRYQTLGEVRPVERKDNTLRHRQSIAERFRDSLRANATVKQPADGQRLQSVGRNRRPVMGGGNSSGTDAVYNDNNRDLPTANDDPSGKRRDAADPIGDATTNIPGLVPTGAQSLIMPGSRTEALMQQGAATVRSGTGLAPGADAPHPDALAASGTPLPARSAETDLTTQTGAGSEGGATSGPSSDRDDAEAKAAAERAAGHTPTTMNTAAGADVTRAEPASGTSADAKSVPGTDAKPSTEPKASADAKPKPGKGWTGNK